MCVTMRLPNWKKKAECTALPVQFSTAQLGEEIGRRRGIPFIYRDFRQGWKKGIEKSKEMKLYRQEYCGCIYSEEERYLGVRLQKTPSA